jgi:hypothetical protein
MKKNIAFLLFAALSCVNIFAQGGVTLQDFSAKVTAKLKEHQDKYPQEKLFLQSDKSQYLAGETIWMKAWCTLDGAPSFLSRTAYIELVNSNGDVVKKSMYKLDSMSTFNGDIELPNSIPSGTYTINAYTLWMLNFPEFILRKHIFIYGEDYKGKKIFTAPKRELQMMFYPEGGDLVDGMKCRVAFKTVIKEDGQSVPVTGTVTDKAGKKVADFTTEHEGMGAFEIDAVAGENYTANINAASGATMQFKLPAVKTNVISLRVENAGPSRMFVLVNKPASMVLNKVRVVAQVNYQVVFSAELNLAEAQNAAAIPKKNLPPGIAQITVFDENGTPLAERLAFIENYTVQKPALITDKMVTGAKGKGQLNFKIDSKTPVALSALVVSADYSDSIYTQENILSSLLLSSDLKGTVNKPGYYFADKDAARLHKLDLLLMTQGWRRFEWKQVLDGNMAALKYPVESSIVLKGKVTKPGNAGTPVTDGRVDFVIKGEDSTTILAEAKLTDKGEFMVNDINFKKAAMVLYQGTNEKKQKLVVDVTMYPMHIDSLKKSYLKPVYNLDTTDLSARASAMSQLLYGQVMLMDTMMQGGGRYLGNVTVRSKKITHEDSLNRDYTTGTFTMGKTVDPAQYANYNTIWKMIQVAVPGVRVEGDPFNPDVSFSRYDGVNSNFGESGTGEEEFGTVITSNGVAYFINEINVSKDVVSSLVLDDIALIKVLRTEAAALGTNQGAIAIYTKKGISAGKSVIDKSFTKIQMQGYALTKEFYNTDYDQPGANKSDIDKRVTLFWNPHMRISRDGKYHLNFNNNDTGKKMKVVVQGIDKEGNIICTEQLVN